MVMFGAFATLATALAFEHIGGYRPCPLCLMERWAYYAAIPLTFFAMALVAIDRNRTAALILCVVGVAFVANTGLGVYHAGAEWGFWEGPSTCSGAEALTTAGGNLLQDLGKERVIRCDQAPWRLFGLSFAGWNAAVSAALAIGGLRAGVLALRRI